MDFEKMRYRLQIKEAEARLNEITSFSFDPEKFGVKLFFCLVLFAVGFLNYRIYGPMFDPLLEGGQYATTMVVAYLTGSSAVAEEAPRVLGWGALAFGGLKLWRWIRYSF